MVRSSGCRFPAFPAALAFVALLPPRRVRNLLERRKEELEKGLAALRAAMENATAMGLPRLFLIEDEYKQAMVEAEIAWLRTVIGDLGRRKLTWSRTWIREVARRMGAPR